MAFGLARSDQRVARAELAKLLEGMGRLRILLEAEGDFARSETRMIMLAMMCLETALPWGGTVMVLRTRAGWRLVAEGDRLKPDPELWSWLSGSATRLPAASEVHFALLAEAAVENGRQLQWEMDETGAEIAF